MNRRLRAFAKQVVPKRILFDGWTAYSQLRARRARQVFAAAADEPPWLGWRELEQMQAEYPLQSQFYAYDCASVDKRGRIRAKELIAMADRGWGRAQRFLDLGSWDGMVCYHLQKSGKTAVGVDNRTEGYSHKAVAEGTLLMGMDAAQLGFDDHTFDFVFSYNSFEHFPEPQLVLQEATRVVRPGGCIYLNFGPLWLSPRGAHQYKSITVPYCECLFPLTLLEQFAGANDLELTDFSQMNKWTLTQYRQLWATFEEELELVDYYETYNANHVDLVMDYPSCFKNSTRIFDDLIVSNIEVLFEKR